MNFQENQNSRQNSCEEVKFIVRNHVKKDENKVCLPITKNRANNLERAKEVFGCIVGYFGKKIAKSLVLYQKVGQDKNGKSKYIKVARCYIKNGKREIVLKQKPENLLGYKTSISSRF